MHIFYRTSAYFVLLLSVLANAQQKQVKVVAHSAGLTSAAPAISAGHAGQNLASFFRSVGITPTSRLGSKAAFKTQSTGTVRNLRMQLPARMPQEVVYNNSLGTPRYISFASSVPGKIVPASIQPDKAVAAAKQFLIDYRSLLKIGDPQSEFRLIGSRTDREGFTHVRFQQQYQGIEVWAKDVYVHLDPSGNVSSFNGNYAASPSGLEILPAVASQSAIEGAKDDLGRKGMTAEVPEFMKTKFGYTGPTAREVIWYGELPVPHLAWLVEIRSGIDHDWYYFIDGATGVVLRSYDNVDHDGPTSSSAADLNGVTRSFSTYLSSGTYYMMDASQPMYDAAHSQIPSNPVGALAILDLRNSDVSAQSTFYYVTSTNNTWTDPSSVSALYNASITYNFYRTVFSRNSINDSGMTIYSVIHVTSNSEPMDNAFWNGYFMAYGDGDVAFKPLAGGLDVAAHEMTHGVTQNSANLEYVDQSGALNESMSDAFATLVDTLNWTIGETVIKDFTDFPTGSLRDLSNPHNGGSSSADACWQPATLSEYVSTTEDNGGVHVNSGIPNHAFYLVASTIGRTEAREIWYKALTAYLTRSSQFVDARLATVNAAGEIFGQSSSEVTAVKNAWSGVGVMDSVGTAQPPASMVVGPSYLLLTNTSPSDPNTIYMAESAIGGNFFALTQTPVMDKPAVSDNGQVVLFVDGDHELRALATNPSSPQEEFVDTDKVWWSVAIGPGLGSIALTSVFIDTTIYYLDLVHNTSESFKIVTQTFDGQNTKTALYADALSFDPTGRYLLFDAYNQVVGASSDTISYWNIGLLDVTTGLMQTVLPPQPQGTDIGDPSFSKTNTNHFAFDYWDEGTGDYYVLAADFNTGSIGAVAGPQSVLGFPSYSSDDDTVAYHTTVSFQSALHDGVNEMPLLADQITGNNVPEEESVDATFPVWFSIGNRVTAEHDHASLPADFALMQNYPNPFNPTTVIGYQLPVTSRVKLDVYDILGREVVTLVDGSQAPGEYNVTFDGRRLASGIYFYVLSAGTHTIVRKLVLMK